MIEIDIRGYYYPKPGGIKRASTVPEDRVRRHFVLPPLLPILSLLPSNFPLAEPTWKSADGKV